MCTLYHVVGIEDQTNQTWLHSSSFLDIGISLMPAMTSP